jgi:hypothetical protein
MEIQGLKLKDGRALYRKKEGILSCSWMSQSLWLQYMLCKRLEGKRKRRWSGALNEAAHAAVQNFMGFFWKYSHQKYGLCILSADSSGLWWVSLLWTSYLICASVFSFKMWDDRSSYLIGLVGRVKKIMHVKKLNTVLNSYSVLNKFQLSPSSSSSSF